MGHITSATTLYANAYLTTRGRELLFNRNNERFVDDGTGNIIDLFKIEYFSIGDPDVNYKVTGLLESGQVPDLSGKNTSCIKGAYTAELQNRIAYSDFVTPPSGHEFVIRPVGGDLKVNVNDIGVSNILQIQ